MDAFCAPAADAPEIDAVSSYVHGGGTPDGTPYKSGIAEAEVAEWTAWEKAGSANPSQPVEPSGWGETDGSGGLQRR